VYMHVKAFLREHVYKRVARSCVSSVYHCLSSRTAHIHIPDKTSRCHRMPDRCVIIYDSESERPTVTDN